MEVAKFIFMLFVCQEGITKDVANAKDSVESADQRSLAERVASMQDKLNSQQQQIQNQNTIIDNLRRELTDNNQKTEWLSKTFQQRTSYMKTAYSDFGCYQDELSLSCPSDRLINVTYATYGMNTQTCDGDCCAPYPMDCTELVLENDYATWLALKYACDNTSACVFVFEGAFIDECEIQYSADYMQIFYDCLPEAANEPLGFTARASTSRSYEEDDVIIFDDVITNYGNGYDQETSFFTCQRHGIYIFGVTIFTYDDIASVELMLDNSLVLEAYVNDKSLSWPSATSQAVVECKKGQLVWMRADFELYIYSGGNSDTLFYGALLQLA